MQGWIKLHRSVRQNWLYEEKRSFSKFEAWIDLLLEVNHKDSKILLGNQLLDIKRGQTLTSIRHLSERWGWSNTKVKNFFNILQTEGMVIVKSDTKKTLITVVKYDLYQCMDEEKTTPKPHINITGQSQEHTNKNEKNEKNEKEDISNSSCRNSKNYDVESVYYKLALKLLKCIQTNNPEFKEPNLQKWADDIRLMMERDKRTEQQIAFVIDWCQKDSFWKSNILCPAKLRKQYDKLVMKIKAEREQKTTKGQVEHERSQYSNLF